MKGDRFLGLMNICLSTRTIPRSKFIALTFLHHQLSIPVHNHEPPTPNIRTQSQHRPKRIRGSSNTGTPPGKPVLSNKANTQKPNSNNHQNTSTPKPPQNRWRMPDERMELICQYLTRAGQEKPVDSHQSHKHARCIQPTLLSHEMEFLVEIIVKCIKARGQLYTSNVIIFTLPDWNMIRQVFSSKFEQETNLSVLECAMRRERYKYVIALFRARCETAKEEQPELGEEYWHWMEV